MRLGAWKSGLLVVGLACTPDLGGLGSGSLDASVASETTVEGATSAPMVTTGEDDPMGSGGASTSGGADPSSTAATEGATASLDGGASTGASTGAGATDGPGSSSSGGLPGSDLPEYACDEEGTLMSRSDAVEATVDFYNESGAARRIFWLDYSGNRYDEGTMAPGDVWEFATYATHPWLIADATGACLTIYVTEAGVHDVHLY